MTKSSNPLFEAVPTASSVRAHVGHRLRELRLAESMDEYRREHKEVPRD